jgi:HAD superfamily hydrolase (TIGR01509 family)
VTWASTSRGKKPRADYVQRFERETGQRLPENFETELRARRERVFRAQLKAVAGAPELVASLAIPSCVASNGPMAQIEHSLRVVGLHDRFSGRIFSAYSVRAWKPDPALFLHAGNALGVPPEHCAVIEDSELGIAAGIAAGMQVFAFLPEGGQSAHREAQTLRALSELSRYF